MAFACAAFAADKKPNVAVLDLRGDKSSTTEQLQAISSRFQAELLKQDVFQILDRSRITDILSEQGFQQTGACTSAECQVQVGRLLGVEMVVSGNIVRFENTYAIELTLIDVETGRVVLQVSAEVTGDLLAVMKQGSLQAASSMANAWKGKSATNPVAQVLPPAPMVATQPKPMAEPSPAPLTSTPVTDLLPPASVAPKSAPVVARRPVIVPITRWGGLALAVIGGGLGVFFNQQAVSKHTTYVNETTQAQMDARWKEVEAAKTNRTIGFVLAGLGGVVFAVSFAF